MKIVIIIQIDTSIQYPKVSRNKYSSIYIVLKLFEINFPSLLRMAF